ncbi:DUF4256 domain-containing protein [Proteiniclasticum ruminis]|uniref:DUF4256 domain-containing protein n=1 Tax=Proteiniclasticum ruminis TaxID=398199 RepID=UPI00289C6053|nr:DUF4256 domain-containing protein [Proteiniclasticum ruminis]
MHDRRILTKYETEKLLEILKNRFERNRNLHRSLQWEEVHSALLHDASAMWSISQMEATGGEPDVVMLEESSSTLIFVDVAKESPKGRRSLCYDREALEKRKANKPENSAMGLAKEMGIELLTEEEYRKVQKMEMLDLKTSSWVKTPEAIRKLGGAIFCDRRYNTVFTYHNGADSYYGSRGFRGKLRIERT